MSENISGYRHSGDIEIRAAHLITSAGQTIDISVMIEEMSVYQDIDNHFLECDIIIQDSLNLFGVIPPNKIDKIQGGFDGFEYFLVSFKNRTDRSIGESWKDYNNHIFQMYTVNDRFKVGEGREVISLSGVSIEFFPAMLNKLSRSVGKGGGKLVSEMIENIVDEYLYSTTIKNIYGAIQNDLNFKVEKSAEYDKTSGEHKFVIPNLTVDDSIEFLLSESDSTDHIPNYRFYEDSNGFKFKNISTLVKNDSKGIWTYDMFNKEIKSDDAAKSSDPYKILSYNVIKQLDSRENMLDGLYRQSTLNVDFHKKNSYQTDYTYDKYKEKFIKLQNSHFYGNSEGTPVLTMTTTRVGHESTHGTFASEKHLPKCVNEIQAVRSAYDKIMFNTVMDIQIPGTDHLNVGDVIEIHIPLTTGMGSDIDSGGLDKYLSGKYLISKIRHKITGGITGSPYASILRISKDTSII
jgi:hypothetical protein